MGPMGHLGPLSWQAPWVFVSLLLLLSLNLLLLEEEVVLGEREGIRFNYAVIIDGIRAVSALQLHSSG